MSIVVFNYSNSIYNYEDTVLMVDIIGYIGGAVTASIMIPQVIKTYKSKKTDNISSKFLILQLLAAILNFIYGLLGNLLPIIIMSPVIGFLTGLMIVAKYIYRPRCSDESVQ